MKKLAELLRRMADRIDKTPWWMRGHNEWYFQGIEPQERCLLHSVSIGMHKTWLHRTPEGKLMIFYSPTGWVTAHEDGTVDWSTCTKWFK